MQIPLFDLSGTGPLRGRTGSVVASLVAVLAVLGMASAVARADAAACRAALLTDLDPPAAMIACDAAVAAAPSDPEARLLRAIARLANLPFAPTVDALADAFGLAEEGRFPPDADLLLPTGELAPDSPAPAVAQEVVIDTVIPALDAALADLEGIAAPFTLTLTAEEMSSFGVTSLASVEVDRSDVLLLVGVLDLVRAAALVGTSYDLDFDVDDAVLRFSSSLDIQTQIVAAHPSLLAVKPGTPARMAAAKLALCAAVDSYHLGIEAIRAEVDSQDDDLIAVGDPALESQVSQELARGRAALDGPFRVLVGSQAWRAEMRAALNERLGTSFEADGVTLDLRGLFDSPVSLRPLAPTFAFDPLRAPPSRLSAFPDPTFAGALTTTAPSGQTSAAPCPPAVVPEPDSALSGIATLLVLFWLAGRRPVRTCPRLEAT